jgi:hypothetical protein
MESIGDEMTLVNVLEKNNVNERTMYSFGERTHKHCVCVVLALSVNKLRRGGTKRPTPV